jgi:uncharacterized protein YbcI
MEGAGGAAEPSDQPTGGQLNAAIVRRVVQVYGEYAGRGPAKAQAFFHGNVVVVVLHGTHTRAERRLVADGRGEVVAAMRREIQRTMRPELGAAVEKLTGARVLATLSDSHVDPDVASEVFVLDAPIAAAPAAHVPVPPA